MILVHGEVISRKEGFVDEFKLNEERQDISCDLRMGISATLDVVISEWLREIVYITMKTNQICIVKNKGKISLFAFSFQLL